MTLHHSRLGKRRTWGSAPIPLKPIGEASNSVSPERATALVERIGAGDSAAFDEFISQHWDALVYYVSTRVRNVDLAKDVAQQAFLRLWLCRSELRPTRSVITYLYQIARNLVIDEYRKAEVRERWSAEREASGVVAFPTPLELLEHKQLRAAVRRAIQELPERRREAFVLVHLQKLSHRQAADVMGTSPQTVANQVTAALAQLRRALQAHL